MWYQCLKYAKEVGNDHQADEHKYAAYKDLHITLPIADFECTLVNHGYDAVGTQNLPLPFPDATLPRHDFTNIDVSSGVYDLHCDSFCTCI
jgi:hypothetical protein